MGIFDRFRGGSKPHSVHEEPGNVWVLDRHQVEVVLAESCRCILEKDLSGLDRLIAVGATVDITVPDGRKARRLRLERAQYLAYVAAEFAKQVVISYRLPIDRVLHESSTEWKVECHSEVQFDGAESFARNREVVTIGIANGHPVVTALDLEAA